MPMKLPSLRMPKALHIAIAGILVISACTTPMPDSQSLRLGPIDGRPILLYGQTAQETRDRLLEDKVETDEELDQLQQLIRIDQAITSRPLAAGNRVELLVDGPMAFAGMFKAMQSARHHIHVETFILDDDRIGQQFADIILDRRKAGVEVRIIFDAFGILGSEAAYFQQLRENGVQLHNFNPINPIENPAIWRINIRHHRKILVVDGRIAFTGGMNISDVYNSSSHFASSSQSSDITDNWRDTHVRLEGPIVADFQHLFVDLWSRLSDQTALSGLNYFPLLEQEGSTLVRVMVTTGGVVEYKIYEVYSAVFAHARRRIWVTQGYFSPDHRFLEILKSAARRGVDVRLLLPGLTDSWLTVSSSRSHYTGLLKAGVRIFERKDVLQHAKTAVVDGIWSTVGSTNLDYRSFFHSNEANAIIYERSFGRQMEELFLKDQELNEEITLQRWKKRS